MNNNFKLLQPLFKWQWLFFILLVLSVVTLFANFGFWQLRRHAQKVAYNGVIKSRIVNEASSFEDLKSNFEAG